MGRIHKKTVAIVIGLMTAVAGVGAAYAYWSAGGAGQGTATTAAGADLVVNQTSVVAGMGPGVAAQTLSGDFDNTTGASAYVGRVTAAITGVSGNVGACSADDYSLVDPAMNVDAQVPTGTGVGGWSGATIAFDNSTTVNQDGCKGATVALTYTIGATSVTP